MLRPLRRRQGCGRNRRQSGLGDLVAVPTGLGAKNLNGFTVRFRERDTVKVSYGR